MSSYRKQHLLYGESYESGTTLVLTPGRPSPWAVAICKDLDFPLPAGAYRKLGAGGLLVPSWDFDRDGWLNSRMAVIRGVENGLTVERTARSGSLTVSDGYGRVLAETHAPDQRPFCPPR